MAKSNRAVIRRQEQKQIEEQSRKMLLAALARKYGEDVGNGERRLVLTRDELLTVPKGERIVLKQGTPADEAAASSTTSAPPAGGVTISGILPPAEPAAPITDPSRLLPANALPHPDDEVKDAPPA